MSFKQDLPKWLKDAKIREPLKLEVQTALAQKPKPIMETIAKDTECWA